MSGPDGSYTFPLVSPGIYQIRVNQTGFRTSVTQDVEVLVNGTTRADVRLVVGSASEQVTVTGAAPLVETANATMGSVVEHESIIDLPLNGRNFAQLGTLIPGVVAAPSGLGGAQGNATVGGFGDSTGSFNVNGMRNQSNNFLLDGAPNNDSFNSGFVMRPPPDAIEEFKIMTHSYEAQYGRNAGSVVNVVTKSGTNQLHGSVWWFNREAALAAKTYFSVTKPNYQQNQFGGAAQAPIIRNKVFISGYYEGFRLKDATSNVLNVLVPGTAERGGNFSELLPAGTTCANITSSTAGAVIDLTFTNFFTKNSLLDFVLGFPTEFQQGSGDPALNGSSWTYSEYAEDQFRVSKRVTLEFGVRYELNKPYVEDNNHLAALHPGQQSTIQPTAPVGLAYPNDINTPRGTYYIDTNNVAPRLGFILDPMGDGKTSVRAAWGLFYDTIPGQGDFFQNGTLAPPFQPLQEIDFNNASVFPGKPTSTYFSNPYNGVPIGAAGFPPGLTFIGWSLPNSFKTAKVQQYNLSVQQQLTNTMGFEVAYVGSRGNYLPIFIEVNPTAVLATGATTPGANAFTAGVRTPFPAFGLTRPTFAAAKSWYDSLQANWQLRSYHNLRATAAYTWSHSLDNASGLNIGGDSRPLLPVTIGNQASIDAGVAKEKGSSLFDARNRIVVSLQYEFPRLDGHSLAERLLIGGWNFNTIFQVQSGSPFAVVNPATTAQSLTFRPNQTCNANSGVTPQPGTLPTQHFINTSCFALPTTTIGGVSLVDNSQSRNAARNSVLGPGFNTTDMSLFKSLNFTERYRFEFRFEAFNVFNEAHFSQPVATFGTGTFGQITSTVGNDSCVIQMANKLAF